MANILQYTTFDSIQDHVSHVRQVFYTGKPKDLKWRKFQLSRLYDLIKENEEKFYQALAKDMNKPLNEAMSGDVAPILDECLYFIDNLDKLVKDEKVKVRSPTNSSDKAIIRKDPLGVVLIIGCWNYPLQLSLVPFAGAIAAGNSVIIKPSEVAPHTAAVLTELFPKYMDTSCYRIVNGGVEETTALLKEKFDHIFYTGNSTVAKIIMTAAAKNLTPVTLELGGKSPTIILSDANVQLTANRIAFGKLYNSGQTCIAVDYVLCHKDKVQEFARAYKKTVEEWYTKNPQQSKDFARIVNDRHTQRLAGILANRKSGDVVLGGTVDESDRYIAPTLVINVKQDDPALMGDEIFGPILPVITFQSVDEAIGIINKREPPLALYVYSSKKAEIEKILRNTQSGGVCVNECLLHQAEYSIPFGGVGNSGMGNYHGKKTFEAFTHERSILYKTQGKEAPNKVKYPPYTDRKYSILRFVLIKHPLLLKLKAYRTPLKLLFFLVLLAGYYLRRK